MAIKSDVKLTYEDYVLFPEDGKRHEIIDGEHYMSPAPSTMHQRILRAMLVELETFLRTRPVGEVLFAPVDVVLSDVDVVQPDILFVSRERSSITTEKNIQGAPDLVVEIISESTRKTDEVTKRRRYEQFGVREYWVVDPELELIKVHRMTEGHFVRVAELSLESGDFLSSPLLPGFSVPLSGLFPKR